MLGRKGFGHKKWGSQEKNVGKGKWEERKMFGLVLGPADFIKDQGIKPLGSLFL